MKKVILALGLVSAALSAPAEARNVRPAAPLPDSYATLNDCENAIREYRRDKRSAYDGTYGHIVGVVLGARCELFDGRYYIV